MQVEERKTQRRVRRQKLPPIQKKKKTTPQLSNRRIPPPRQKIPNRRKRRRNPPRGRRSKGARKTRKRMTYRRGGGRSEENPRQSPTLNWTSRHNRRSRWLNVLRERSPARRRAGIKRVRSRIFPLRKYPVFYPLSFPSAGWVSFGANV